MYIARQIRDLHAEYPEMLQAIVITHQRIQKGDDEDTAVHHAYLATGLDNEDILIEYGSYADVQLERLMEAVQAGALPGIRA